MFVQQRLAGRPRAVALLALSVQQSGVYRARCFLFQGERLVALGYPPATGDAGTCNLVTLDQEEVLVVWSQTVTFI